MDFKYYSLLTAVFILMIGCSPSETPDGGPGEGRSGESDPASSPASAGVEWNYRWAVGETVRYQGTLKQEGNLGVGQSGNGFAFNVDQNFEYVVTLKSTSPEGEHRVAFAYDHIVLDLNMGFMKFAFDSRQPAPANSALDPQEALLGPIRGLTGKELTLFVDADGRSLRVEGKDELLAQLPDTTTPQATGMIENMLKDELLMILVIPPGLPDGPVAPNDTWNKKLEVGLGDSGKIAINNNYQYAGTEERDGRPTEMIKYSGTISGDGKADGMFGVEMTIDGGSDSGQLWFDSELGRFVELQDEQKVDLKVDAAGLGMPGAAGGTMTMKQTTHLKLMRPEAAPASN